MSAEATPPATPPNPKTAWVAWRGQGESCRGEKGALAKLKVRGLLTVETECAGAGTRHVFHVL
jgi:hypothetical protein